MGHSAWTPVDEKAQAWTPVQEPSAMDRFVASTGLTSEGRTIPQQLGAEVSTLVHHPVQASKEIVTTPVTGYFQAASEQGHRMVDHFNKGDYSGAALHGLYYLLTPVGGANMGRAAEQLDKGDIAGAAGSMTMPVAGIVAGSPATRSGAAAAVNATRSGVATALDASAKPVSAIATGAGVVTELAHGNPVTAGILAAKGKPYIAKAMNTAAELIRPGESPIEMLPLTRQLLRSPDLQKFLTSPGLSDEVRRVANGQPPDTQETSPQPLKATTPAAAPAEILKKMGVAAPNATLKPMESIQPGTQSPAPWMTFGNRALSGESAALWQLTHTSINQLRGMALQRGLQVTPEMTSGDLIKSIHGSLTPQEINSFEQAASERMQPDYGVKGNGSTITPYVQAVEERSPQGTSHGDILKTATDLKYQDEHMAELLQKSIEMVNQRKAAGQVPPMAPGTTAALAETAKPQTVGNLKASMADTGYFQAAKKQLGPSATISQIAQLAQKMKDAAK